MGGFVGEYSVEVKPTARKELEALPDNTLARVISRMEALRYTPRPAGCKKLKGYKDQWRIRVGDWRVVYVIDDTAKRVSVTRVRQRREVLNAPGADPRGVDRPPENAQLDDALAVSATAVAATTAV